MMEHLLILVLFPLCMALAASMDLVTFTIPNKISLALIVGFFIVAFLLGLGWNTIVWHIATFLLALLLGFTLFAFNLLGGGDAKVYAAASLWIGMEQLFAFSFFMTVIGGLLGLALLRFRSIVLPSFLQKQTWLVRLQNDQRHMPYGLAISAAALLMFPHTMIFKSLV